MRNPVCQNGLSDGSLPRNLVAGDGYISKLSGTAQRFDGVSWRAIGAFNIDLSPLSKFIEREKLGFWPTQHVWVESPNGAGTWGAHHCFKCGWYEKTPEADRPCDDGEMVGFRWRNKSWPKDWQFTNPSSMDGQRIFSSRMYGMDYDYVVVDEPEKSPVDKAIEEMMAKRKAKRGAAQLGDPWEDGGHKFAAHMNACERCGLTAREAVDSGAVPTCEEFTHTSTQRKSLDRAMSKLIPAETDFRSRLVNVKVEL